jgi:hypothetical protein
MLEALAPGATVSEVARRHDLRPQQVFGWLREARKAAEPTRAFVPVVVEPAEPPAATASAIIGMMIVVMIVIGSRIRRSSPPSIGEIPMVVPIMMALPCANYSARQRSSGRRRRRAGGQAGVKAGAADVALVKNQSAAVSGHRSGRERSRCPRMNREITACDAWGEDAIIARGRNLFALAKTIWKLPAISAAEA